MNNKFENHSSSETPSTGDKWRTLAEEDRINLIKNRLSNYKGAEEFKVLQADIDGQIVVAIEHNIPANERGLYLLELEKTLKQEIDSGLNLWCEPVGDKSKLRNLRGVVINTSR